MHGLIVVNKPVGMTSRDVVDRVKRLVRPVKTGHTGTLDPIAAGVLVICIGDATRLSEYILQKPKSYRGTFLLDCASETDDAEQGYERLPQTTQTSFEEIQSLLPQFTGVIEQVPPNYSAVKIAGQRAYKLARRGEEPNLKSRKVTIYELRLLEYEYPRFLLEVRCGSGTYIRALGRDLAKRLGTSAVMSALVRTAVGEFDLASAIDLDQLDQQTLASHLLAPLAAVGDLPRIMLQPDEIAFIKQGRQVSDRWGFSASLPAIAGVSEQGNLVAILRYDHDLARICPVRNFNFDQ